MDRTDPVAARRSRFAALWARIGGGRDAGRVDPVHAELEHLYGLAGRHYHTMRHIVQCLEVLDAHAGLALDADAVELAVWFHDAIYVPGARDNEARSAELLVARAGTVLGPARREHVVALIMATVHPSDSRDGDAGLLGDVDLSGFAQPRAGFLRDSARVRREFAGRTEAEFWRSQRAFLDALTHRPSLYATPTFRARDERPARANIAAYRDIMERRHGGQPGRAALRYRAS